MATGPPRRLLLRRVGLVRPPLRATPSRKWRNSSTRRATATMSAHAAPLLLPLQLVLGRVLPAALLLRSARSSPGLLVLATMAAAVRRRAPRRATTPALLPLLRGSPGMAPPADGLRFLTPQRRRLRRSRRLFRLRALPCPLRNLLRLGRSLRRPSNGRLRLQRAFWGKLPLLRRLRHQARRSRCQNVAIATHGKKKPARP